MAGEQWLYFHKIVMMVQHMFWLFLYTLLSKPQEKVS